MLWDLDRSSHQRNYFPNCTYGTGNFERCGCLSRHFTWLGVMRIPSVVAAWIRHVRAWAPAGHVTVDIGLLKNAKFQGGFKKWMLFSHLSQIRYELEKKSSLVTRALSAKSCARDTDSLHSCTRLRLVQEMACLYHSCKILPRKHSYPNLIPIIKTHGSKSSLSWITLYSFLRLQIIKSDYRANVVCAVSLVIGGGHFIFTYGFVFVCKG